jgi:transcription-repair coupling factor (superfamily II helicase)
MDEDARTAFRSRWRERIEGDPTKVVSTRTSGPASRPPGIEYYLPLFFDATSTVFDYLGAEATVALHGDLDEALKRVLERHARAASLPAARPGTADPAAGRPVPQAGEFFGLGGTHAVLSLRKASQRSVNRSRRPISPARQSSVPTRRLHHQPTRHSIACPT